MKLISYLIWLRMCGAAMGLLAGQYYSTPGGFNNTCTIAQCDLSKCPTAGTYLNNCAAGNSGSCAQCNAANLVANSVWGSNGKVANDANSCEVACNSGYAKVGGQCTLATCQNTIPDHAHYRNTNGAPNSCPFDCDSGYEFIGASNICQACAAGTYQTVTGSCAACDAGSYTNVAASTVCKLCAAGSYTPTAGYSTCIKADLGNYVPTAGSKVQTTCGTLTFADQTGMSACTACDSTCPNGQYKRGCGGASSGTCDYCS